jgi:hypothetical protein
MMYPISDVLLCRQKTLNHWKESEKLLSTLPLLSSAKAEL